MTTPAWAKNTKALLKRKGLKQEDLPSVLKVETAGAVSHYFTGRRELSVSQLEELCRFLDVTPQYLLGFESQLDSDFIDKTVSAVLDDWIPRFDELNWVKFNKPPDTISDVLRVTIVRDLTRVKLDSICKSK